MLSFNWFRWPSRTVQLPDTFTLRRQDVLLGVAVAIERCDPDESLLVAAHFPETLSQLVQFLDADGVDFQIGDRRISSHNVRQYVPPGTVVLTLSEMLIPEPNVRAAAVDASPVSLLMTERHPMIRYDEAVMQFMNAIPGTRRIAYFMSLEDPLIRSQIPANTVQVLRQFGLEDSHLVSSHLVSRAIQRAQRKIESRISSEIRADSPADWLARNLDPTAS